MKIKNYWALLIIATAIGCSDKTIPVFVNLDDNQRNKLKSIKVVTLSVLTPQMTNGCEVDKNQKGYYLVSGDTSISNETAIWTCPTGMSLLDCPNLRVEFDTENRAIAYTDEADYSLSDIEVCAKASVDYASMEYTATTQKENNATTNKYTPPIDSISFSSNSDNVYIASGSLMNIGFEERGTVFGYDKCPDNIAPIYGVRSVVNTDCIVLSNNKKVNVRTIGQDGFIFKETWSVTRQDNDIVLTRPNGWIVTPSTKVDNLSAQGR